MDSDSKKKKKGYKDGASEGPLCQPSTAAYTAWKSARLGSPVSNTKRTRVQFPLDIAKIHLLRWRSHSL